MIIIVDIFVSFIEMFLLFGLLEEMYPLRWTSWLVRRGFLLAATLSSGVLNELGLGFIGSVLCIVICILYAALAFQGGLAHKVGTMAIYAVLLCIVDFSTLMVADVVLSHAISDSLSQKTFLNDSNRLILMLISKFIFFWLIVVYIYYRRKSKLQTNTIKRNDRVWIAAKEEMLAASLCFITMFMVVCLVFGSGVLEQWLYQYLIAITILIFGMYLLLALLIRRVNYTNERTNELRLKLQREQMAKKHREECQIFLTEFQGLKTYLYEQFQDMERLVDAKDHKELQEYFDAVDMRIDDCQLYLSGNESFDIVINQKLSYAKEQNIHIQLDIQKFSIRQIADVDIVRLFSNVLDNAIEAVMQVEADSIYFSLKRRGDYIIIEEENACPYVKVGKNGQLKTTKGNKMNHGMGLGIIESIVRKYNGHCDTRWEKDRFFLKLILEDK